MTTRQRKPPSEQTPAANGAVPEEDSSKVLDLISLTPSRKLVRLPTKDHPEGETFELRLVDDFGIEMQQKLLAWSRQFTNLMSSEEELDDDQAARMRFLLESLFEQVLGPSPDMTKTEFADARRGMDDAVRHRVVQAFSWAPVLARNELQTELIKRLVDRKYLKQEQVDEVMDELRLELTRSTSGS